jgi:hypothetical protein
MWRPRNGFTLLFLIIALCSSAAAQPGVAPEHRPAQGDSDEQRIADLVVASRILVQEGVLDSFGHVTVRSLKNPNHYFMPRAVAKDDPSLRGKLMVNNAKLGAALAKTLGNDSVVLIRGHGNAVVGASVPWAVLRAVYTQLNARVQMEAIALGGQVIYLNEDELKMHPVEVFDVDRPWQNLKSRLPKNF